MIYAYKCKFHGETTVVKPANRSSISERCPTCTSVMKKLLGSSFHVGMGTFKEGHYHAFGKAFTQKSQLDDHLRRIKGETGKEIVELGNDSMSTIKRKKNKVDIESASKELNERLNSA